MGEIAVIKNIKIHFEIKKNILKHFQQRVQELNFCGHITKHTNFITLTKKNTDYAAPFTYIIFPTRGFINATGIKNYNQLEECVGNFCAAFHLGLHQLKPKISVDNITASGRFEREIDLREIFLLLQRGPHVTIYNVNHYPGLKFKVCNLGTVILFSSGKYTIVGLKCLRDATTILKPVSAAIMMAHPMGMDMKYVKDAEL